MEYNGDLGSVLIALIIISACLFGFYLLMKKWNTIATKNKHSKYSKVIDHMVLSRDKYIQFIEIGDDILVLGISSSRIEVLHQLKKGDLREIEETIKFDTFKDTFSKFLAKRKNKSGEWDDKKKIKSSFFITLFLVFLPFYSIYAEEEATNIVEDSLNSFAAESNLVSIMILLLVLTLISSVLLLMTSYTRILIVLSFTRNALGTQQMPPNQVMIGIALVLTFFIMTPTITEIKEVAYDPYVSEEMSIVEALEAAEGPLKEFMYREAQTEPQSLNMFLSLSGVKETPETLEEISLSVLIPAFVTSELTKAFKIGFMIYLPFIMIDMIVASILMSMGMMMLPPAMISLPFKIMLFVLVDGWELIMKTIVMSFG